MKLIGQVQRGQGFATLAFGLPTANLELTHAVTLAPGAYVAYTFIGHERYPSVAYIGPQASEKFEVHLFNFSGDLYDQQLEVEILKMVSAHVPWKSEEQMRVKVAADVALAKAYFAKTGL